MSIGEELREERRRRRRAGDPRLSAEGREAFRAITRGELAEEFQDALDVDLVSDPLVGGDDADDG